MLPGNFLNPRQNLERGGRGQTHTQDKIKKDVFYKRGEKGECRRGWNGQ